jgi:hypothetical protein
MSDRGRAIAVGVITALICGILISAAFTPLIDLSPRAVARIERAIGFP